MRDAKVTGDAPQGLLLRAGDNLGPTVLGDAGRFHTRSVASGPASPASPEHSLGIEERDEGRGNDVYLAQPIPVASAG